MKEYELKWIEAKRKLLDIIKTKKLKYEEIIISFSGGKDSTILLKMIEELDLKNKIRVVFFNTFMEYDATYRFIDSKIKEGWNIEQTKPKLPAPLIYKKYGKPFQSKMVSEMINRLQIHNFDFINDTNKDYDELIKKYPNCSAALSWLTGKNVILNCPKWIKKQLEKGINFKIANKCCEYLKKKPVKEFNKENKIKLSIIGVRLSEGGVRKIAYKSCMDLKNENNMRYYPLLNFTDEDINEIIKDKNIKLSDCYEIYGLKRTGCVGCPFGKEYKQELEILKKYEPNKYIACINMFKDSYDLKQTKKTPNK